MKPNHSAVVNMSSWLQMALFKHYTVSQKTSPSFISRILVKHCPILIIFGGNIPEKILLKEVILFSTSPNSCFCTTWETKKLNKFKFYHFPIILLSHLINQTSNQHILSTEKWSFLRQCIVWTKCSKFCPCVQIQARSLQSPTLVLTMLCCCLLQTSVNRCLSYFTLLSINLVILCWILAQC